MSLKPDESWTDTSGEGSLALPRPAPSGAGAGSLVSRNWRRPDQLAETRPAGVAKWVELRSCEVPTRIPRHFRIMLGRSQSLAARSATKAPRIPVAQKAVAPKASAQNAGKHLCAQLASVATADSVEVSAIEDPEVEGVTLYISDFKRSISEKLKKDFFTEPSQCRSIDEKLAEDFITAPSQLMMLW
eukprot:gene5614-4100_t